MIRLKDIEKVYKDGEVENKILTKINLEISDGEFVSIMGKSGSGKSTLLNILTGIDKPTKGEVQINGVQIVGLDEDKMANWRGGNVGIVFQFFQLMPTLSALENVLLAMDLVNKIPERDRTQRAKILLDKVGLSNHIHKLPSNLSGGEQQRVAIARALTNDANIIVADEPTGNLDSKNADIILEIFNKLKEEGKTIIMVTHERECIKGIDRKIVIKDGEIVENTCMKKGVI